jgi:D-alanyl-lipoteichoic acid acyltransferase DltB (MBOAT superfamily)
MLFNSGEFLFFFLPVVFLIFIYLARTGNTGAQIVWLVIASVVFYGSWKPIYLLLMFFSMGMNFGIGRILSRQDKWRRRSILVFGVTANLALLAYYKYANFFVENLNAGFGTHWDIGNIILPLAISFYTFTQIAYLVDAWRGEAREYSFMHYCLFVTFFPHLIAGPLMHHQEIIPQFAKLRPREELWPDIAVGLTIMAIGMFKKVVLADSLALYVDPLFDAAAQGGPINTMDAWIATIGFSLQIYFDFSGYSDMAIGSARLFGIRLPENFRSPYKSASIIDFWRRWHMTLSRFLRDYLYISLGGNRHGSSRRYLNLVITMLLGGLWHGAAWTFVIWGGLHGLYLCINHGWRAVCGVLGLDRFRTSPLLTPIYVLITSLASALAFLVFRAADVHSTLAILKPGFTHFSLAPTATLQQVSSESFLGQCFAAWGMGAGGYLPVYTLLGICLFICWFLPNTQQYMRRYDPVLWQGAPDTTGPVVFHWQPGWGSATLAAVLFGISLLSMSAVTEFIYFQF